MDATPTTVKPEARRRLFRTPIDAVMAVFLYYFGKQLQIKLINIQHLKSSSDRVKGRLRGPS
jgi:hypothetical protein